MNNFMFDIIIIGAGPGGTDCALYASKNGLKVCLVEMDKTGGTCLNRGCIPTKTYYHLAKELDSINKLSGYGLDVKYDFDFSKLQAKKAEVVDSLRLGLDYSLDKQGINIKKGKALIINDHEISVNDEIISAEYLVIATGSKPEQNIIKNDHFAVTSDEILNIDKLPKKLIIIGAGVIGIELGSIYNKFGVEVEIVEMMDMILPNQDREVAKRLYSYLTRIGIKFHLKSQVKQFNSNNELVIIEKEQEKIITSDMILMTIGRKPNLEVVNNLQGLLFNKKQIIVNEHFQTSIPNIYAIGDVIGKNQLAHFAQMEGIYVIDHILKKENNTRFDISVSAVFTFPECGFCGKTEEELKKAGINYEVKKSLYKACGKAVTSSETEGFVKCLFVNDSLVGVHIIGSKASELISEANILISQNIKRKDMKDIIFTHPTLSEVLKNALI